jgi:TPP-dependent pyruvate/acetoin dehydrogenase alpha subunit
MTFFFGNPQLIVCETYRVADHVSVIDARMYRDKNIARERPHSKLKVVPMAASHSSLKTKAQEDKSEFDRKFSW